MPLAINPDVVMSPLLVIWASAPIGKDAIGKIPEVVISPSLATIWSMLFMETPGIATADDGAASLYEQCIARAG